MRRLFSGTLSTYTRVALTIASVVTVSGALVVLSLRIALGTSDVAQVPAKAPPRATRRVAELPVVPPSSQRSTLTLHARVVDSQSLRR